MSKTQFQTEYNNLINQGIHEIYAKIILADKYKDIIDANEIIEHLAEENDEIYNAIIEGEVTPLHLSENNISDISIQDGKKESSEAKESCEAEAETVSNCETEH